MKFPIDNYHSNALVKTLSSEIERCNTYTKKYGLTLTKKQIVRLIETRFQTLRETNRIEFSKGVIEKLIYAFCDSPFISTHNYEDTLHELIAIFYQCKNETKDLVTDDELIDIMAERFNGICQGSLELLAERELFKAIENALAGLPFKTEEEDPENEA